MSLMSVHRKSRSTAGARDATDQAGSQQLTTVDQSGDTACRLSALTDSRPTSHDATDTEISANDVYSTSRPAGDSTTKRVHFDIHHLPPQPSVSDIDNNPAAVSSEPDILATAENAHAQFATGTCTAHAHCSAVARYVTGTEPGTRSWSSFPPDVAAEADTIVSAVCDASAADASPWVAVARRRHVRHPGGGPGGIARARGRVARSIARRRNRSLNAMCGPLR